MCHVGLVYAGSRGDASNVRLLGVVMNILAELLGGDPAFSHRLSRSPFYTPDEHFVNHRAACPLGLIP